MDAAHLSDMQQIVPLNTHILQRHGIVLGKDARILDFGCGSGRHTYEYIDAGYPHAAGFDVSDYVRLRDESDRDRFHFSDATKPYEIPFPDNHFDFVTSTSVFEHVQNQAEAIAQIRRVLKPGGVTLHVFPSRWRPIEPHIFVPFGGAMQDRWWLSTWAWLGVRNPYQQGLTAADVTTRNAHYCENGIRYLNGDEIAAHWQDGFASVDFAERDFIEATRHASRVSRIVHPLLKFLPGTLALYRLAHTRVILARKVP